MSPSKKNKPIIEQFRAAGRLINEWRDTICYAVIAAATARVAMMGHPGAAFFVANVSAAVREGVREQAWKEDSAKPVLAGLNERSPNRQKLSRDAGLVTSGLLATGFMAVHVATNQDLVLPFVGLFAGVGYAEYKIGNGFRSLAKDYTEIMWDYPRKKDGGNTQTQRLKEGFVTLGRQVGRLIIRPALNAWARPASCPRPPHTNAPLYSHLSA